MPLYDVISILRMIALRFKKDKHSWEQLNSLMSHKEEWAKNPTWKEQHQHALGLFHSALNPLMCPRNPLLFMFVYVYVYFTELKIIRSC